MGQWNTRSGAGGNTILEHIRPDGRIDGVIVGKGSKWTPKIGGVPVGNPGTVGAAKKALLAALTSKEIEMSGDTSTQELKLRLENERLRRENAELKLEQVQQTRHQANAAAQIQLRKLHPRALRAAKYEVRRLGQADGPRSDFIGAVNNVLVSWGFQPSYKGSRTRY